MSNLELWESVEQTNPKYTKHVTVGGQNRTTVDAQHKKKCITEAFGPYGMKWGVNTGSESFERVHYDNSTCLLIYQATAFYFLDGEKGEFPIAASIKESYITKNGNGYLKIDDEAVKKVRTDALTKGFTDLGFNADVHMGKFDDQDYIEGVKAAEQIKAEEEQEEAIKKAIKEIGEWCKMQTESAAKISTTDQYEKAMLRIAEKTITRCRAAGVNSSGLTNRINELIKERKENESGTSK